MVSNSYPSLEIDETDATIVASLDRPKKLNALDTELASSLHELLGDLNSAPEKGLLLRGNGATTCAGADTSIVANDDVDSSAHSQMIHEIYQRLHRYPRPTVMACKGAIVGAAFQFALASDIAVVGEETTISKAEIEHGIYSEFAVEMTAHEIGRRATRELYLSGDPLAPERALAMGFASAVVPEDTVDSVARSKLHELVEKDTVAYEKIKRKLMFYEDLDTFELYS
ncbi:enoyl-CoA hydratase/isomerase family protein [Halomarina salina]|uniref:Enoyl-CoA hydratase/isomerase family protein n=1 Tax=Halomarina salina TaxID=1872699 RepID=A0ABD5RUE0_9EURY|nr:enoyl-CoA hydratase/isomerase family protein [Halomarina salina]